MPTEKTKVLLLEDDPNLGFVLQEFFQHKNYAVDLKEDGEQGLMAFNEKSYDICVVDIMMPKMDGFTFTKLVRKTDKKIPIIFLTAKSMKEDKLEGFKLGGDDYMTKPFSMEELEVRIEAVLRRSGNAKSHEEEISKFTLGKYNFDYPTQKLHLNGDAQSLTTKETELLKLLGMNINQVVEREAALKLIWGNDSYFTGRSMDVYITKLRKYLKEDPNIEIVNVHGTGFKLMVHEG